MDEIDQQLKEGDLEACQRWDAFWQRERLDRTGCPAYR